MKKTVYICQLSEADQQVIRNQLVNAGLSENDIEIAMDGRLCDLEDTIKINL